MNGSQALFALTLLDASRCRDWNETRRSCRRQARCRAHGKSAMQIVDDNSVAPKRVRTNPLKQGAVTRRRFLRGAFGAGTAVAAASLLAACGGDDDNDEPTATVVAGTVASPIMKFA